MRTKLLAAAIAVPDRELLARIGAIAGREREANAELVAHLAALELRPSLYLAEGFGSLESVPERIRGRRRQSPLRSSPNATTADDHVISRPR